MFRKFVKRSTTDMSTEIRDERLLRLYLYWMERKGARRFPSRGDVDPLDFPYLLGNIMLLDVLGHPPRFRVRLHGSNMVMRAGYDLTGKFLTRYVPLVTGAFWVLVALGLIIAWHPEGVMWWIRGLLFGIAMFLGVDSLKVGIFASEEEIRKATGDDC